VKIIRTSVLAAIALLVMASNSRAAGGSAVYTALGSCMGGVTAVGPQDPSGSLTCVHGVNHDPASMWPDGDTSWPLSVCDSDLIAVDLGSLWYLSTASPVGYVYASNQWGSSSVNLAIPSGCSGACFKVHVTTTPYYPPSLSVEIVSIIGSFEF